MQKGTKHKIESKEKMSKSHKEYQQKIRELLERSEQK